MASVKWAIQGLVIWLICGLRESPVCGSRRAAPSRATERGRPARKALIVLEHADGSNWRSAPDVGKVAEVLCTSIRPRRCPAGTGCGGGGSLFRR